MMGIQETVQKTEVRKQIKQVKKTLESYGKFHPDMASILNVESEALRYELRDTLNKIPLHEFLAKSSTAGIAGAAYMVPDALHSSLIGASYQSDKVPLFAAQVVNGWKGGDLLVDIAARDASEVYKWTLHPERFTSGAKIADQEVKTVQATLSPIGFSVAPRIGYDLVEDTSFAPDLIEWHVNQAGQQIGQYATDLALADLIAANDGDGAQAAVTAGGGTTGSQHVLEAVREVGAEFWHPNTMIITYESWGDTVGIGQEQAFGTAGDVFQFSQIAQFPPPPEGYDAKYHMLDVIYNNSVNLFTTVTTGKMTACKTLVLDRNAALLCGRKRWMQIENYAQPVKDLASIVVTCRQDSVTLYKDASCEISET